MKPNRTPREDTQRRSPPSRGVWIETRVVTFRTKEVTVAPLAGGVD